MIDQISDNKDRSIRASCRVLGFRRQTYYDRKNGRRPEEADEILKESLRSTCQQFIAWGFWMIFHFLRNEYDLKDNHKHGIELKHIQPGKPSQNGLIERMNKTLRLECLNLNWFESIDSLNESIQEWSVTYNQNRPHKNLGYRSPVNYEKLNENFYFNMVAA